MFIQQSEAERERNRNRERERERLGQDWARESEMREGDRWIRRNQDKDFVGE